MNKSTSIHNINADKELNKFKRIFWIICNWANNLFPYTNIDNNLEIRDFKPHNLKNHWKQLNIKISPPRKLSDLFWIKLPWDKIKKELSEINIFDTGCGSGSYGAKLLKYSNNNLSNYTGIDIYKHKNWKKWEKSKTNIRFYVYDGKNLSNRIPKNTNFFMTQSAIEHFDEDLNFFKQIRDYIISHRKSVVQVHLFPSSSCIKLYKFHGVRQYTPRNISKITRLFNNFSYAILFRLGGKECINLHQRFIKQSVFKRENINLINSKTKEYDRLLFRAIEDDKRYPNRFPIFYALVLHSYWKEKLF